jgi:hypothetical protein
MYIYIYIIYTYTEFPGFATDGEVSRQRAMLEDALLADGVIYDNLSFKVHICMHIYVVSIVTYFFIPRNCSVG